MQSLVPSQTVPGSDPVMLTHLAADGHLYSVDVQELSPITSNSHSNLSPLRNHLCNL